MSSIRLILVYTIVIILNSDSSVTIGVIFSFFFSFSGFEKCIQGIGSVVSEEENGIYQRLSPDQDIDGEPHYFKNDKFPRHLYYMGLSSTNVKVDRWVIGKTCNVEVMGTQAYTKPRSRKLHKI